MRALQKEFLVKLRNVYSFFTIYANIDGVRPARRRASRSAPTPELDRWIASELALTTRDVTARLDAYDVYGRRSGSSTSSTRSPTGTCAAAAPLLGVAAWDARQARAPTSPSTRRSSRSPKLIAPFTPFIAEAMYQNLVRRPGGAGTQRESVHLERYPRSTRAAIDETLSREDARGARARVARPPGAHATHKLKVRQPLRARARRPERRRARTTSRAASRDASARSSTCSRSTPPARARPRAYVAYAYKPNFRTLGQRGLGKKAQELKKSDGRRSRRGAAALWLRWSWTGEAGTVDGVELVREDVEVVVRRRSGLRGGGRSRRASWCWTRRSTTSCGTSGFVRELQNRVQTVRKEMGLEYTDRIRLALFGGERLRTIVGRYKDDLASEVLATEVTVRPLAEAGDAKVLDVEGEDVRARVTRV